MRAECLRVPVQRRYYSSTGSLAHIVSLALVVLVVFLPLFLAHGSHGFWPKTNTYLEQPRVKFAYTVLSVLEGERVAPDGQKEYLKLVLNSLPPRVQRLLQDDTRASQVKSYDRDLNRDNVPESLHIRVDVPLEDRETIFHVQALVILNVTLQNHVRLNMDAVAAVSHVSQLALASLRVDGDLRLEMREPARVTTTDLRPFKSTPILNASSINSVQDLDIGTLLSRYRSREWLTTLDVAAPTWTSDLGGSSQPRQDVPRTFTLELTIRIPRSSVLYRPTWSELLKTAWIQYFSILVIVHTLCSGVRDVLFRKKILDTYSTLDDARIVTKSRL
ncbi:hypothetical protein PINS_up002211 [Pythium insidiosum]|nr:hypothetical protein PINS_up002211 [Pythium insidiosum]